MRDISVLCVYTFAGEGGDNAYGRVNAFKRAVRKVQAFDYRRYAHRRGILAMNQRIISRAKGVDLVQLGKCESVLGDTVRELKEMGCKVIHFYGDYRPTVQPWVADIGKHADLTLLYHKDPALARAHEQLCGKIGFWWVGTDPKVFYPRLVEKEYDVVFMGNRGGSRTGQGGRTQFFKYLRERGVEPVIHGHGWGESRPFVSKGRFAKAVSKARIALGYNTARVPWYTSWRRVFNCMASGTLFLTRYFPGLEEVFERGVHLDWFKSEEEAVERIEYYLAHEEEREKIAAQGRQEVLSEHTWDHRIEELLRWID